MNSDFTNPAFEDSSPEVARRRTLPQRSARHQLSAIQPTIRGWQVRCTIGRACYSCKGTTRRRAGTSIGWWRSCGMPAPQRRGRRRRLWPASDCSNSIRATMPPPSRRRGTRWKCAVGSAARIRPRLRIL